MSSSEQPEADAIEQRQEIAEDEAALAEALEISPEVNLADAAEQRRPAGTADDEEDYPVE